MVGKIIKISYNTLERNSGFATDVLWVTNNVRTKMLSYSSYLFNDQWPLIFIRPLSFNPINRRIYKQNIKMKLLKLQNNTVG